MPRTPLERSRLASARPASRPEMQPASQTAPSANKSGHTGFIACQSGLTDRHEQREPAATEQRIKTEPNGWLPSAQCRGWPRENGLDAAKSSLSLMKGLAMLI